MINQSCDSVSFIIVNNKRCGVQILDCTVTLKEEGYDKIVNGLFLNSLFVAVLLIFYGVPVAVLRYGKTYNKKGAWAFENVVFVPIS